jgi:hypothetical protein
MLKIKDFGAPFETDCAPSDQVGQEIQAECRSSGGGCAGVAGRNQRQGDNAVRKTIPPLMFVSTEQSRLATLRNWVLENAVTEISMNERQFWNLAGLQPVAEKPWTTFMGRPIFVPDMPVAAQKCLGIFDMRSSTPSEPALAAAS